jgi:tryptophan synthase alpha chain
MTYSNPVLRYGITRLDEEAAAAGLDGILVSDLVPEESERLEERFTRLEQVFLAAPTSAEDRLERIARASRGFVYLVARTGVTGAASDVEAVIPSLAARLRQHTLTPLAAGFGISSADDVRRVWRHADGAIVGSAIVRFIEEYGARAGLADAVARFVGDRLLPRERGQ